MVTLWTLYLPSQARIAFNKARLAPKDIPSMTDKELLALKGIGPKVLIAVRDFFPYQPEETSK